MSDDRPLAPKTDDWPTDPALLSDPFGGFYVESDELRRSGFAEVGDNVRIAGTCRIIGRQRIRIGNNVRIDDFTIIIATGGDITIGSHVHIASGCLLSGVDDLTLEDFSGLSHGVKIYTASDDYSGAAMTNPTVPSEFTNVHKAPVNLGRHVIVGTNAVVLPGVEIGEGSAVGALSLVSKSLEPWGIYSGIPARRVKARKMDLLEAERRFLAS